MNANALPISKNNELGVMGTSKAFENLWARAAGLLGEEELEWFSGLADNAKEETANLASIIMQLGCLIASDGNQDGHAKTGSFQSPDSVAELLFAISSIMDAITGLLYIAGSAQHRLTHPNLYKPKAGH
jgi:hypothetical protein